MVVARSATKGGSSPAGTATQIGLVPSIRSIEKCRCDEGTGVGHGDADHILPDGGQGVVAGDPEMIGVLHADPAGAAGGRLSNGNLHGIGGYDKAEAAVAVDDGGGGGLMEDSDDRAGVGPAGLLEADIPDEACYTMRINASEVCAE